MNKAELFSNVKMLTDKLAQGKQSGTITFKSQDEKLLLQKVYNKIYPTVLMNLACSDCVKQYLYFLQAWYEREYPIYQKTLNVSTTALDANADTQTAKPIQHKGKRKKVK